MAGVKGMGIGNKNRSKGGRLKIDFSLSGDAKAYFKKQARAEIRRSGGDREPSDDEIKAICRRLTKEWWEALATADK